MIWFSKSNRIDFPSSLKTDNSGFSFLAAVLSETARDAKFIFDFKQVEWIEANLCAVLGAIIETNKTHGASFTFENFNNSYIENTLRNNGFLTYIKEKAGKPSVKHTGIPFQKFDLKNEDELEEYIYKYVLTNHQVPEMSEGAQKKVYRSIFEMYQNSVMHSGAQFIFVCGQYYKFKGRMALTMVEIGKTFKENVTSHNIKYAYYTGKQSIEWAVESGNTTKPASETGGLGLDLIREFLKINGGKLQIRSADGYWVEKKGIIETVDCQSEFQGSIVNIEFNLRDRNSYYTSEDIDIDSIF